MNSFDDLVSWVDSRVSSDVQRADVYAIAYSIARKKDFPLYGSEDWKKFSASLPENLCDLIGGCSTCD
jgi:hypothetical protein